MNHCPNCGERIVGEPQFCRSCGAELFASGGRSGWNARTLIVSGLFSTLLGALVVLAGGVLGSKWLSFAGCVLALISFGVMVLGALMADGRRRGGKANRSTAVLERERNVLDKADTTNRLPPIPAEDHFPPSVAEHTTNKLHIK